MKYTRGAALLQTPLLALIRCESNALGFVVTVVVNSGSTAVVVATLVLAVAIGEGAKCAGCVIDRMHD